ncbi:MAG: DNA-directed RNA polymerase subunit alpha [Chloroflexota bacterium]|nr:DNA-directed RNA polymerase subunit alpha [Chloroflexota bacterium]
MLEQPQFTIERVEQGLNYGRYVIGPLDPGYGTTLGNSLRRIMLRSLEGVAVARIRIDNVWHEFSTIPNVREDVTEIVLNLKGINLRVVVPFEGELRAHLFYRGDGEGEQTVTAGDISWPGEVEIVNPDHPIATVDGSEAVIDMDLWITSGRGYVTAETQESSTLGEIPIDAIFTPIERVNFVVESTRVGQAVDFDRLILEILTNGSIDPEDALTQSAEILRNHAQVIAEFNQAETAIEPISELPPEVQNTALADLGLSPRVLNALRSKQIEKVGQVLSMDPEELLSIRNFGPRSLKELRQALQEAGLVPSGEEPAVFEIEDEDPETREAAEAIASLGGSGEGGETDEEEQDE